MSQTASGYQKYSTLSDNQFYTDPTIPDPDNLPVPLGWHILVRPYPVEEVSKGGIILTGDDVNFMSQQVNVARVVAVGSSCWNRSQHEDRDGNSFDWVKVGDFISYPRHKGADRKFKGVAFTVLSDDDIVEVLPDPMIFHDDSSFNLNIPQADLEKYNTVHNPSYKGQPNAST